VQDQGLDRRVIGEIIQLFEDIVVLTDDAEHLDHPHPGSQVQARGGATAQGGKPDQDAAGNDQEQRDDAASDEPTATVRGHARVSSVDL
jgi:hypothetical protein